MRGESYAGSVALRTPFGLLYSTNITSDREAGIGDWSFEDFHRSMKEGVCPDGSYLYFPFDQRALPAVWKSLFHDPDTFVKYRKYKRGGESI